MLSEFIWFCLICTNSINVDHCITIIINLLHRTCDIDANISWTKTVNSAVSAVTITKNWEQQCQHFSIVMIGVLMERLIEGYRKSILSNFCLLIRGKKIVWTCPIDGWHFSLSVYNQETGRSVCLFTIKRQGDQFVCLQSRDRAISLSVYNQETARAK